MNDCKYYTIDCKEESCGCEGCKYNKPVAMTDRSYCVNSNCATKEECDRYIDHYIFDDGKLYCFIEKCEEYQG